MKEKLFKIKSIFTKRNILIMVNVLFFACVLFFCCFNIINELPLLGEVRTAYISVVVYRFALIQCVFTFLSLVVYYLSIMAEALNKKYEEQVKAKEEKENK